MLSQQYSIFVRRLIQRQSEYSPRDDYGQDVPPYQSYDGPGYGRPMYGSCYGDPRYSRPAWLSSPCFWYISPSSTHVDHNSPGNPTSSALVASCSFHFGVTEEFSPEPFLTRAQGLALHWTAHQATDTARTPRFAARGQDSPATVRRDRAPELARDDRLSPLRSGRRCYCERCILAHCSRLPERSTTG